MMEDRSTPEAWDARCERKKMEGINLQLGLTTMARKGMLPTPKLLKTPCAADAHTENMSKKEQKFGNSGTLAQEVQTGFIYQRGMLPTPRANQVNGCDLNSENLANRNKGNLEEEVAKWVVNGMLPIPKTNDYKDSGDIEKIAKLKETSGQYALCRELASMMLPTPTRSDHFPGTIHERTDGISRMTNLNHRFAMIESKKGTPGKTFQLNPRFVAEMMGFPPNWTESPFQNGETNP
jgi:hypothetical protein